MAIKTYSKSKGNEKLSKNFNVREFACKCNGCNNIKIDEALVSQLQNIRTYFGKPLTINSGYRCSAHNKKVGGATNSYHVKGQAADIAVKDVAPSDVAKYAESIGVLGIGLYDNFVHIDTRTTKSFWYGHEQIKKDTFGGKTLNVNTAVEEWQKAAIEDGFNLPSGADGIWGPECEAVAKKAICKRCYWPWKNKNLTRVIQKIVGVETDGKFGNGTKNAVVALQKLLGLPANGVVDYATWKRILGV